MYDLIIPFGSAEQAIIYTSAMASAVPLTLISGTYSLTANDGTVLIGSTAIEGQVTTSGLITQVFQTIDAQAVDLPAGPSVMEFLLSVQDANSRPRRMQQRYILNVPGVRTFNQYPTAADLQVFLVAARMLTNPPADEDLFLDLDTAVLNAVNTWEQATGYVPFLAGPDDTTRSYFPQDLQQGSGGGYGSGYGFGYGGGFGGTGGYGTTLPLRAGLLSLQSVTAGGQTFTPSGTPPIRLLPDTAPGRNRPYEELQFCGVVPWGPVPNSTIDVLGRWGFCAELKADQFTGMLKIATLELAPLLSYAATGADMSFAIADVKITNNNNPFALIIAQYTKDVKSAIGALGEYKRYSIA